jgi:hypothetical protein
MATVLKLLGLLLLIGAAMVLTAPSNEMAAIGTIGLVAGLVLGATLGYHLGAAVKKHGKGPELRPSTRPQPTSADLLKAYKEQDPPYSPDPVHYQPKRGKSRL